jgi:hypothetical protein
MTRRDEVALRIDTAARQHIELRETLAVSYPRLTPVVVPTTLVGLVARFEQAA